jgi:predicted permease
MKFYGVGRLERSSLMLSSFCLNGGNFGLSVANFAFGEAVLARAVVVYIGNTALNYTLGVFVASSGRQGPRSALLTILRVPAFYATITAFLLRGFNIELPTVVFRSVTVLKDAAIPAMLILLGLQLTHHPRGPVELVSTGVLKLFISHCSVLGWRSCFICKGNRLHFADRYATVITLV